MEASCYAAWRTPSASDAGRACYRSLSMVEVEVESDGQLVRRIAAAAEDARDAEAELCRRFGPRARLYGLRHLRDEERARDLAQAVLLALLVAARGGRVQNPDQVDRFVLGTCRNVASRIREIDARAAPVEDAQLDVLAVLPRDALIDTDALVRCLAALDGRARIVLELSFHEQKSTDEIARQLVTTPGNVRVLRHRAVAQLRHCLEARPEASR
jgi:RNA polymerase sigma-70 factor (ECF subfamily)